jgi:alkylation response protein AidB-like acyl-CoA dehydrogenase
MDLNLSESEREFQQSLRGWLGKNCPKPWAGKQRSPDHIKFLREWQRTLFDGGWAGIHWPKEYGGQGATPIEQAIFQEEMARANAPEQISVIGLMIVGPTIIAVGTEEQKKRYLAKILSCEEIWCQGFSEPNAGSDLASLSTRAVDDGDHFVVNGQKIWTSFAHIADWCLLLARTNPDVPKHKGLTALLVDMHSPGVEAKPLRQMSGEADFNEVFFTNVRVPKANVFGQINDGWTSAVATLMNERANLGSGLYVISKKYFEGLLARVKEQVYAGKPVTQDPIARQRIAQAFVDLEVYRLNTLRALSKLSKMGMPGPEGSILKLFWSDMNQKTNQIAQELLGFDGQIKSADEGKWVFNYLRCRANSIEGGTSEIMKNIIAQRVLGMPKSY